MAITTSQFTTIADNIAKALVDLESAYITGLSSNNTTINTGMTAASNSLFAHFAALSTADQAGQVGFNWEKAANKVATFTGITSSAQLYPLFQDYLEALDYDLGGLAHFVANNSLVVHPEFAAAFNAMCLAKSLTGLHTAPPPEIEPPFIFTTAEVVLASVNVTGAAAGTFNAGTPLDVTKYAPAQLQIKNTKGSTSTGTATSFTITYTNAAGATGQTVTQALSGALNNNALLAAGSAVGSAVSNIVINSGGSLGDIFSVTIEPVRTVTY